MAVFTACMSARDALTWRDNKLKRALSKRSFRFSRKNTACSGDNNTLVLVLVLVFCAETIRICRDAA